MRAHPIGARRRDFDSSRLCPFPSFAMAFLSASSSAKSKIAKFAFRFSFRVDFGNRRHALLHKPAQRYLIGAFSVFLPDVFQRIVIGQLAARQRAIGGDRHIVCARVIDHRALRQAAHGIPPGCMAIGARYSSTARRIHAHRVIADAHGFGLASLFTSCCTASSVSSSDSVSFSKHRPVDQQQVLRNPSAASTAIPPLRAPPGRRPDG